MKSNQTANNICKAATLNKFLVTEKLFLNFVIFFFFCFPFLSVKAQLHINETVIIDKNINANTAPKIKKKPKIDDENPSSSNKTYIKKNEIEHLVKKNVKQQNKETEKTSNKDIDNEWGDWANNGLEPTKNNTLNQKGSLSKEFGVGVQGSIELEINILDKSNLLDDYSGVQAIKVKDIPKNERKKKGKE